jgi:hypothetical protein
LRGELDNMEELVAMYEQLEAAHAQWVSASNAAFKSSEPFVTSLFEAYAQLEEAESKQINLNAGAIWRYSTTTQQISALSEKLAADLSDDQKTAYQNILKTVEEGSAEWLNAHKALQGDLGDSARQGAVAQLAELQALAGELEAGGLAPVYVADAKAAEEARAAIEAANLAIINSYQAMAFEAVLAQTGVTEGTLALGVQLGIMTKAEADARMEFTNTTMAIGTLTADQAFLTMTTRDQVDAIQLLALGYASSADEAQEMALLVRGDLSTSLAGATGLTDDLREALDKVTGKRDADISINIDGLDELREAAALANAIGNTTGFNTPTHGNTNVTAYSDGGWVTGGTAGRDSVPAMLMPGEFVIRADAARTIGADTLQQLNQSHTVAPQISFGGDTYHIGGGGESSFGAARMQTKSNLGDRRQTAEELLLSMGIG